MLLKKHSETLKNAKVGGGGGGECLANVNLT